MSLSADLAQPTIFTLSIAGPYSFQADGAQHLTLYYDKGLQVLSGIASGSSIAIPLDGSNFAQFLHGFTAGRSLLIAEGTNPSFAVNLAGSSAAVASLGQCTEAEGFTQLPPPWHASASPAAVADQATSATDGTTVSASPATPDTSQAAASVPQSSETSQTPQASSDRSNDAQSPVAAPPASNDGSGGSSLIFIALAVFGIVAWRVAVVINRRKAAAARDLEELRRRRRAQELIEEEISRQASRLGIRRSQLVFPDFYGTPDLSKWNREMELFCTTRLMPLLEQEGLSYLWPGFAMEALRVLDRVALSNNQAPSVAPGFVSNPATFDPRMDPLDYERHCALLLRDAGWNATLTPATGDQGADVIAEKAGVRLVVQCKLYSQPVGNDAVQQAFSAKKFQRAQMAAVVSNAPFTPSARQLAMTTGVLLLHHDELRTLDVENVYGNAGEPGHA